jgi:hypothetical protein
MSIVIYKLVHNTAAPQAPGTVDVILSRDSADITGNADAIHIAEALPHGGAIFALLPTAKTGAPSWTVEIYGVFAGAEVLLATVITALNPDVATPAIYSGEIDADTWPIFDHILLRSAVVGGGTDVTFTAAFGTSFHT